MRTPLKSLPNTTANGGDTQNKTTISFSKAVVVTGLNKSGKAEQLNMAGDVVHMSTELIADHMAKIDGWRKEEGIKSPILLKAMREISVAVAKLRESRGIIRTCPSLVSPLNNATGSHAIENRDRREEVAREKRLNHKAKKKSEAVLQLEAYKFHTPNENTDSVAADRGSPMYVIPTRG